MDQEKALERRLATFVINAVPLDRILQIPWKGSQEKIAQMVEDIKIKFEQAPSQYPFPYPGQQISDLEIILEYAPGEKITYDQLPFFDTELSRTMEATGKKTLILLNLGFNRDQIFEAFPKGVSAKLINKVIEQYSEAIEKTQAEPEPTQRDISIPSFTFAEEDRDPQRFFPMELQRLVWSENPNCAATGRPLSPPGNNASADPTEAHHVLPHRFGGRTIKENMVLVLASAHSEINKSEFAFLNQYLKKHPELSDAILTPYQAPERLPLSPTKPPSSTTNSPATSTLPSPNPEPAPTPMPSAHIEIDLTRPESFFRHSRRLKEALKKIGWDFTTCLLLRPP